MTEKRFDAVEYGSVIVYRENGVNMWRNEVHVRLNELYNENEQLKEENMKLKSENNMLKVTIGRNEAYINRLTHTSKWR